MGGTEHETATKLRKLAQAVEANEVHGIAVAFVKADGDAESFAMSKNPKVGFLLMGLSQTMVLDIRALAAKQQLEAMQKAGARIAEPSGQDIAIVEKTKN